MPIENIIEKLLSNPNFWVIISAMSGAIVGSLATAVHVEFREYRKDKKEKKMISESLLNEVKSNSLIINQKIGVVEQCLVALNSRQIRPTPTYSFQYSIYNNYFYKISNYINPIAKDNYENIYSRLKLNEDYLNNFEEEIRNNLIEVNDKQQNNLKSVLFKDIEDVFSYHIQRQNEIINNLKTTQELIKKLIENKPKDIYYRNSNNDDVVYHKIATPDSVTNENRE